MEILSLATLFIITASLFVFGKYIWGALFAIIFVIAVNNYLSTRKKQKELLIKYGYTSNPVVEIRRLLLGLKKDDFSNVKKIICGEPDVLSQSDKLIPALELHEAFKPVAFGDKPTTLPGAMLQDTIKTHTKISSTSRILIAEMKDNTFIISWGLYLISDKRLKEFLELAQKRGVIVEEV